MEPAVRSRLNVLIFLCAGILGIGFTHLVLGQGSGLQTAFIALFPTAIIILLAFSYIDYNSTAVADSKDQVDS